MKKGGIEGLRAFSEKLSKQVSIKFQFSIPRAVIMHEWIFEEHFRVFESFLMKILARDELFVIA